MILAGAEAPALRVEDDGFLGEGDVVILAGAEAPALHVDDSVPANFEEPHIAQVIRVKDGTKNDLLASVILYETRVQKKLA